MSTLTKKTAAEKRREKNERKKQEAEEQKQREALRLEQIHVEQQNRAFELAQLEKQRILYEEQQELKRLEQLENTIRVSHNVDLFMQLFNKIYTLEQNNACLNQQISNLIAKNEDFEERVSTNECKIDKLGDKMLNVSRVCRNDNGYGSPYPAW